MLTTSREYRRLSALISDRAVSRFRAARNDRERVDAVLTHQVATAQASANAFEAMLTEQRINSTAERLLNSVAFTTDVEAMLAMIDAAADDFSRDRLVESLVQNAGRAADTVGVLARPHIAHVRHLTPPSCSRCAVLAGRIYRWSTGFLRHPGCDCVMIPTTVSNDTLVQDPVELMRLGLVTGLSKADQTAILEGADFNRTVNQHKTGLVAPGASVRRKGQVTIEEVLASSGDRKTALEKVADLGYTKPKRPASSAGGSGGGKPPVVPTTFGEMPDPGDRAAWNAYWARRQAALEGPDFTASGETLEAAEVMFVEQMLADGHRLSWIRTGSNGGDALGTLPTNDFTWHTRGDLQVEHKGLKPTTPVDAKRIGRQIRNALDKNDRLKVVENVIVDVGDRDIPLAVIEELRNRRYAELSDLKRVWVMTRGRLIQIAPK